MIEIFSYFCSYYCCAWLHLFLFFNIFLLTWVFSKQFFHFVGDEASQYGESDADSEDSNEERPAKRRKLDKSSKEIQDEIDEELAKNRSGEEETDADSESQKSEQDEEDKESEQKRIEEIKVKCEEIFKEEPDFT